MQSQPAASSSSSTVPSHADRLYVGNLAPTVDEYTLIQVFTKYGKITKMDFMFHKTGPLKGKPRGFAFIQFSDKGDALKAMVKLHDRLLRGRKLVVTFASSAPPDNTMLQTKGRRAEPPKTTTLSLLKSRRKPQSAEAQIAAMEAKLATMAQQRPAGDWTPGSDLNSPALGSSASGSPAPLDVPMGEEEGKRAALELEREIQGELGQRKESVDGAKGGSGSSTANHPVEHAEAKKDTKDPVRRGLASLPKKPLV
ncbi:hypothetical protein L202_07861 [Cryptococcus amylolentus CBS 6039]|uniref:Probable RNA-binding protein 18 n=2 Tax=Cryptococcus amylolentus TaxID=104669 RepID=A0A1E3HAZ0_9TREE|nr:hypothetical protein L202_07861 [Cryptococcus amylolentus CBS 6039]ODN73315.1 hypothetical protein L202_07861 [Cryptococcus amylolentus CBS 6039]ODN99115.1 hypothetical protein I350_07270 [Cryptococcus amylolentus CBS 6273]